jgi:FtsP/CotA-like multicopper oxidase with cupredoxin domain
MKDQHSSEGKLRTSWNPSRRGLLTAGTGAAAAFLGARGAAAAPVRTRPRRQAIPYVPFQEPPSVHSAGGVLSYALNVGGEPYELITCSGTVIKDVIRRYNGLSVGATMRIRRGDRMDLVIKNKLPKNKCNPANFDNCCPPDVIADPTCCPSDVNEPHCFNTTNLHTHGLHVSPASFVNDFGLLIASDEVLLHVEPGHVQPYCIQLPDFHAPGTYWYHAHKHGATAVQLTYPNALCGALIVQEDDDEKFLDDSTPDRVWLIQESVGPQPSQVYSCVPGMTVNDFLVNGLYKPTLKMTAGKVERWRFINATSTPRGFGHIQLLDAADNPQVMHLIAVDGILFYGKAPQPKLEWQLAPGGRADFLVQLPQTGASSFYKVRKAQEPGVFVTDDQDLAYVVLDAEGVPDELPDTLPPLPERTCYLRPIAVAEPKDAPVVFAVGGDPCGGANCTPIPQDFTIDGLKFDPARVDHKVKLGAVEQWELQNTSGSLHPFHIHVNPFQVEGEPIDPAGPDGPSNWMWRDTVSIPSNDPIRIRHRFLTYDGKYVLHCHILNHEDLGMMQIVQTGETVYDPATGARISGDGVGPCEKVEDCSF